MPNSKAAYTDLFVIEICADGTWTIPVWSAMPYTAITVSDGRAMLEHYRRQQHGGVYRLNHYRAIKGGLMGRPRET